MVESDGVTTLIGRTETHGRPYPDILEKMILNMTETILILRNMILATRTQKTILF